MSKDLQNILKLYDDYSKYSPEEIEQIIDKINKIGCMSFIDKREEEVESNGTDKETV